MSTAAASSREARRRRIAERGADRLALITGRIQSLPPEPDVSIPSAADSPQPEGTSADSSVPPRDAVKEVSQQDVLNEKVVESLPSSDNNRNMVSRAASLLDSLVPPCDAVREVSQQDVLNERVVELLPSSDNSRNLMSRAVSLLGAKQEYSQVISSIQRPLLDHQNGRQRNQDTITTGQISSAFTASEQIRMISSVATALLVILSSTGFPILGWGSIRSILLFRPVYLLLLTNITIALARVILETQGKLVFALPNFSGDTMDQVGKALEAGLLFKNVSGALFVDFGIYSVVLTCGLSLARRWAGDTFIWPKTL